MEYDWPGNVRQLMNAIERGVVLAEGKVLEKKHLPDDLFERVGLAPSPPAEGQWEIGSLSFQETKKQVVRSFEIDFLSAALKESRGNVTKAASQLGMKRQSLQQKLKELGIDAMAFRRR